MAENNDASEIPQYDKTEFRFITKQEFENMVQIGASLNQLKDLERLKRISQQDIKQADYPYIEVDDFKKMMETGHNSKEHFERENLIQKEKTEKIIRRLTMDKYEAMEPTKTDELRIALIGKTGSGKSATGNTLLAEEKKETETFKTGLGNTSITFSIVPLTTTIGGTEVTIIDTPGLFDTRENITNEDTLREISKLITIFSDGIHAFLYVSNVTSRVTAEEHEVFNLLNEHFGDSFQRHCIFVFTHADDILKEVKNRTPLTLQQCTDDIKEGSTVMKSFFEEIDDRIIAIDNNFTLPPLRRRNREAILALVQDVSNNGKTKFSNDLFKKAQERKEKAIKTKLGKLIAGYINKTLRENPSFISEIDKQNVSPEFIKEIESQIPNKGFYKKNDIEKEIRNYMKESKEAIDDIFNEIATLFQKFKRKCIIS